MQQRSWLSSFVLSGLVCGAIAAAALVVTSPLPTIEIDRTFVIARAQNTSPATVQQITWPALFGTPPQPADPIVSETTPLAPVNIPFVLNGIITRDDQQWALIDGQIVARVGDALPDGFVLRAVNEGAATIEKDGETYKLPSLAAIQMTNARNVLLSAAPEVEAETPLEDPQIPTRFAEVSLGQITEATVRRVIARGGNLSTAATPANALEIKWVRPRELYDMVGLRAGDVITAVNDQTITGTSLIQGAKDAAATGVLRLDILEGGEKPQKLVVHLRE